MLYDNQLLRLAGLLSPPPQPPHDPQRPQDLPPPPFPRPTLAGDAAGGGPQVRREAPAGGSSGVGVPAARRDPKVTCTSRRSSEENKTLMTLKLRRRGAVGVGTGERKGRVKKDDLVMFLHLVLAAFTGFIELLICNRCVRGDRQPDVCRY